MILLSLDEMERLVYAQFLQSLQPIEFNILMAENGNDSITIIYYRKYILKQVFGQFILIASGFRMFCIAIRNGCRVTQEAILTSWVGIFTLE